MTIMDDDLILDDLQKAVTAAVSASSTPNLPVKYANIIFTPPSDQKYLELVFIPNNLDNYWGDEKVYRGIFRMILRWPAKNEGAYVPMRVLKSIAEYFTKNRYLEYVKIQNTPDITGVLEEDAMLMIPSSLRYQSFRQ